MHFKTSLHQTNRQLEQSNEEELVLEQTTTLAQIGFRQEICELIHILEDAINAERQLLQ